MKVPALSEEEERRKSPRCSGEGSKSHRCLVRERESPSGVGKVSIQAD